MPAHLHLDQLCEGLLGRLDELFDGFQQVLQSCANSKVVIDEQAISETRSVLMQQGSPVAQKLDSHFVNIDVPV